MTLIKSISGIRGTIGGFPDSNLTPLDVVRFSAAYATWLKNSGTNNKLKVVTGRDARPSGPMVHSLVNQTLIAMGVDVIDLGLSTTPTVAMAVPMEQADGGIILTASHNPKEWNALKLLNHNGEFINAEAGKKLLSIIAEDQYEFSEVDQLGKIETKTDAIEKHIHAILELPLLNPAPIKMRKFKIVVDGVHSTGGLAIPALLEKFNVEIIPLYCEPTGDFPHNPEPLKEHLGDLCLAVVEHQADMGIAVDPDVDRLVFVDETGELFGEEYTQVACADYVLSKTPGPTVSNLSSSRALSDVSKTYNQICYYAAVGEVNVVEKMKAVNAAIGGEGNGGVIYPDLHYGRDALVGTAFFLSLLVERNVTVSALKKTYPAYSMSKNKVQLTAGIDVDDVLNQMKSKYDSENPDTTDGVKIDFEAAWVHLRKSNTEPIVRIYTEAKTAEAAETLAKRFVTEIEALMG